MWPFTKVRVRFIATFFILQEMRVRIDAHSDANELDTNKAQVQPSPHRLFLLESSTGKHAHDLWQARA